MNEHDTTDQHPAPGLSSADWADEASRRWLAHADQLEAMLMPVDQVLVPAAHLIAGASVLDVGCGRGATARAAAVAVGPSGHVTGVDISSEVVAEAADAPAPPDGATLSWIAADAATHPFPPATYDRVISRFGTLFFDDPVAAFANLQQAIRPDGELVMAVWQPRDASEFQSLAIDVAARVAAGLGHELPLDPPDAGPFAYGHPDHVTDVLHRAGWSQVSFTPHELVLYLGGPGTTPEQAVELGRTVGPLRFLLADVPDEVSDAVTTALRGELAARWDGTGVPLTAAIAIVSARPVAG